MGESEEYVGQGLRVGREEREEREREKGREEGRGREGRLKKTELQVSFCSK